MEKGKSKLLGIVLISILSLTAGCVINFTKNQYCGTSDQTKVKNQMEANDVKSGHTTDALTNKKDGGN